MTIYVVSKSKLITAVRDAILRPERSYMTGFHTSCVLVLVVGASTADVSAWPRQNNEPSPTTPIVSVVGCGSLTTEKSWMLTQATEAVESNFLYASDEELMTAALQALGTKDYILIGTADFLTKEDLLNHPERARFTRPSVANATGQLEDGRKLFAKGLLITTLNEMRLNLVAVHQLSETCE